MDDVMQRLRRELAGRLWVKPALASFASLLMALLALFIGKTYDASLPVDISEDSLVSLFGIFASSMLTVATFTVTAISSAASGASNVMTSRASRIVLADTTAQFVMSAFIAAFIYSVMGILALKAFHYGPAGRFTLFLGLIGIVTLVLVAFISWVDHALKFGRHGAVLSRLTEIAQASLSPDTVGTFGARVWDGAVPEDAAAVAGGGVAYVVAVDAAALQALAESHDAKIVLATRPGELIETTEAMAYITPARAAEGAGGDALIAALRDALVTDETRHAEHDIRFNLLNLAESADRALSTTLNDFGTVISVLNAQAAIFTRFVEIAQSEDVRGVRFDRVLMPPLKPSELVNDAFTAIARDGAGVVEVGVRLQKTLAMLVRLGHAELAGEARQMSLTALGLAEKALQSDDHVSTVRRAAELVIASRTPAKLRV